MVFAPMEPKKRRLANPFFRQEDDDLSCGPCGWRPRWLQFCNNMKVFMFCYVLLGICNGIFHSYWGSVLPSIEKRFGLSSTSMGVVKSISDVSQLLSALFIAHYGGSESAHCPRWIAAGSFIVGLGLLLMATPEFLFPMTPESSAFVAAASVSSNAKDQMCSSNAAAQSASNCATAGQEGNLGPLVIFGMSEFLIGLGSATTIILGLPFVNQQVNRANTSIYYAISFCGKILGPLIGTALAAVFNSIYFNFTYPNIKPTDPRWISAWYCGLIISGLGVCFFALCIGCFPSTIPENIRRENKNSVVEKNAVPKKVDLRDLPRNLKRLAVNVTYVIKLFSLMIEAFVLAGFMMFSNKFMQEQYHLPQSVISLAGGIPPMFAGFAGIVVGSLVIKRFKFRPLQVVYLVILSSIVGAICYLSVIAMGCDMQKIVGVDDVSNPYNLNSSDLCAVKKNCHCDNLEFNPVCDQVKMTSYVSPCIAGCRSASPSSSLQNKFYVGCACASVYNGSTDNFLHSTVARRTNAIPGTHNATRHGPIVSSGLCPKSCPNFVWYVVSMAIAKFCMGLPTSGIVMIAFRIVDTDIQSLAIAVILITTSAFGLLPAPIVVGKFIDSTCRLWQTSSCGQKGACWLYNVENLRITLFAALGFVRVVSCILELIIGYRIRNLTFEENVEQTPGSPSKVTFKAFDQSEKKEAEVELQHVARQNSR